MWTTELVEEREECPFCPVLQFKRNNGRFYGLVEKWMSRGVTRNWRGLRFTKENQSERNESILVHFPLHTKFNPSPSFNNQFFSKHRTVQLFWIFLFQNCTLYCTVLHNNHFLQKLGEILPQSTDLARTTIVHTVMTINRVCQMLTIVRVSFWFLYSELYLKSLTFRVPFQVPGSSGVWKLCSINVNY